MKQRLRKVLLCPLNALGDGLNFMMIGENLALNGIEVDVFHNSLWEINHRFSRMSVMPYPPMGAIDSLLDAYDLICIQQNDREPFHEQLISQGEPGRVDVFYFAPFPSKKGMRGPHSGRVVTDHKKGILENLEGYCRDVLGLQGVRRSCGIERKGEVEPRKVIFHTVSTSENKNWSIDRFLQLAEKIDREGGEATFIFSPTEYEEWKWIASEGFSVPQLGNMEDLARELESGAFFVGNDSGIGHMCSALGLYTVTIGRRKKILDFWKPGFSDGQVVYPRWPLPNFKGMRLKDQYWRELISVRRVMKVIDAKALTRW
ncbi:MAG: hypothetical protein S4CHLAM102_10840 [Chlamydiia bacterium]|nr:hypothetical protein [Chlamydiia bacterium]